MAKPVAKFKAGQVAAAIWENEITSKAGTKVPMLKVTVARRYMDKDGNWQTSSSLRVNDLPRAGLVLQKAYEYLVLKEQGSTSLSEEEAI